MKFKLSFSKQKHTAAVVCVGWNNAEELFSCSDDHTLFKWNIITGECFQIATFPEDFFPTGINLFPKVGSGTTAPNKQNQDYLLITTADGRFHIVNQNGRIEKSVSAHQGACLAGQWSPDGAGLLTAGEDGLVKVWSRGGLLRSCVVQSDAAVYCAVWGPDSTSILHSQAHSLVVKQLHSNNVTVKWKAHEGIILCVTWNSNNNLILSGGEDGYFKIWDSFGQPLSTSVRHDYPVMDVCWAPAGDLFAVSGYNLLRLCDSSGWSYCLERPNTGSIQNIAWSIDGTQVAAACSNGHLLFAHVISRQLDWKNYTCMLTGRKTIQMTDVTNNTTDQLDYPERVVQMCLSHGHLIVATVKQCFIHSTASWNTPVVFELKDGAVNLILMSERCICIVERMSVTVYSYLGRMLASPRWASMRPDSIGRHTISLGPDMMAVVDQSDRKTIHIFDLPTGLIVRSSSDHSALKITHHMTVSQVALSQTGPTPERQLAFIDFNRDLYITTVKDSKIKLHKLGVQVLDLCWSTEAELLSGLRGSSIVAWCCPRSACQQDWLQLTTVQKELTDLGRNPTLLGLDEGIVHIRKGDGSLMHVSLASFPEKLLKYVSANQWPQALKLCRTVEDETLWACLAVLAWQCRELDVAEESFAVINLPHQVEYIQHLRSSIPVKMKGS